LSSGTGLIRGRAHRLGHHVNTDLIIPATHLVTSDPEELGRHLLEGHDPGLTGRLSRGDVLVAGENFGSGSSREHAALAIKGAGISCVIAASFARIFFRNAINTGLPIVESRKAAALLGEGDEVEVDLPGGTVRDLTTGGEFVVDPYPEFMQRIIDAGGLVAYLKGQGRD
jgi:3-isopropylmalate/(R)-2-methylmalate dehydratase small subunit